MKKKQKTNRKTNLNIKRLTFILKSAQFVIQMLPIILAVYN